TGIEQPGTPEGCGIVDQNVHSAPFTIDALDSARELTLIGDITGKPDRGPPQRPNILRALLGIILINVDEGDARAAPRQNLGYTASYIGASPRNNHNLVVQHNGI